MLIRKRVGSFKKDLPILHEVWGGREEPLIARADKLEFSKSCKLSPMQYESILFKVIEMLLPESLANVAEAFDPPPLQSELMEISKEREESFPRWLEG